MNYLDFNNYIEMLADEFELSGCDDIMDYCHEAADGSEYVIYWGKAWELVNMIRSSDPELFESAQYGLEGMEIDNLDRAVCVLAYEMLYQTLNLELNDRHNRQSAYVVSVTPAAEA